MTSLFMLLLLLVSSRSAWAEAEKKILAVVPSTLGEPLVLNMASGELSGIVPDYMRLIAENLGRPIQIIAVPKNRIDEYMAEERFDINCYTHPDWVPNSKLFYWSNAWTEKNEFIFGARPLPKTLSGFEGKTIGTILGYKYPKMDELFASKKIIREDAPNEEANQKKLLSGRISYIITDDVSLRNLLRNNKGLEKKYDKFVEHSTPIHCALHKKSSLSLHQLNKAMTQIKTSKKLEATLNKYGN